ncbi:hypothetical protein OVY01_22375 [Robbsia sp. Bb-Pol-6]|uniref:Uncharacterized protein n=1 Tax=Robbsia betulipollinis TaxID=2981849 RepID=A0ABT3ZTK9_9BURK|nr:hypothetical protein [Robbsia betulipollinis]MCY0389889.1 hypothetical protein [Robbsia betulipollinis]
MNADEFLATGIQRKRSSKLAPFRADLLTLQKANVTLDRMADFLNINGVQASRAAIAKFLTACQKDSSKENPLMTAIGTPTTGQNSAKPVSVTGESKSLSPQVNDMLAPTSRLSPAERRAVIEKQTEEFFPNRFTKQSGK